MPDGALTADQEKTKPYSPLWEYNHNNVFTVYRIYYRGIVVDPKIFPPVAPREVEVPAKKTEAAEQVEASDVGGSASSLLVSDLTINPPVKAKPVELSDEERRAILKEVKDHTELLREFEGVIPDDELAARKRALYAALPPVPPPAGKKQKKGAKVAAAASDAAKKSTAMEEEDWDEVAV